MIRLLALCVLVCLGTTTMAFAGPAEEKLALLEAAVDGDKQAQYQLAKLYELQAVEESDDPFEPDAELQGKALHWYEAAAVQGMVLAKEQLLTLYSLSEDDELRKRWLPLATAMAEQGSLLGCYRLGQHYYGISYQSQFQQADAVAQSRYWFEQLLRTVPAEQSVIFERGGKVWREVTRHDIEELLAILDDPN